MTTVQAPDLIVRTFDADEMHGRAVFSPDEQYRYELSRTWDATLPALGFNMLNPSTATEQILDPTIRRCIGFARAWGYGGIVIGNAFALRSTNPANLRNHPDPVGPANDAALLTIRDKVRLIVCAWGVHGALYRRDSAVRRLLTDAPTCALGLTKAGHPKHPLYVPAAAEPIKYPPDQQVGESTAADVQTDIPLLQPCCIDLGQHYLVYAGRAWCGCQRLATAHVQPDDDGGDTLIRQSR